MASHAARGNRSAMIAWLPFRPVRGGMRVERLSRDGGARAARDGRLTGPLRGAGRALRAAQPDSSLCTSSAVVAAPTLRISRAR